MSFLKKHYEKLILGVVLVGLAGVAAWLPIKIQNDKSTLRIEIDRIVREPDPLPLTDVTEYQQAVAQVENPPDAQFTQGHNLFNPVKWIRMPDGRLVKISRPEEYGISRLEVAKILPLKLQIEYERPSGTGFYFSVLREASDRAADRRKRSMYVSQRGNNDVFNIIDVQGPAEDPVTIKIELVDSKEQVVLSKSKGFERIDGYSADLNDPIDKKTYENQRVDDRIVLAGDTNIIVAISSNEVVFRAVSNEKNTTLRYTAVP